MADKDGSDLRFGGGVPGSRRRWRPFGRRHQAYRYTWRLAWLLLARWTPAPLYRWRNLLLRAFGARLHPSARIYPSVTVFDPRRLTMGAHSVLGRNTRVYNVADVVLDDHADVAWSVDLIAAGHDLDDLHFAVVAQPIRIGTFAWVAMGAMVGSGVTIGDGAVLGARGVAFSDLEPWTIYAGNPAVPLRRRPETLAGEAAAARERIARVT